MNDKDLMIKVLEYFENTRRDGAISFDDFFKESHQNSGKLDAKRIRNALVSTGKIENIGGLTRGAKYIITESGIMELAYLREVAGGK